MFTSKAMDLKKKLFLVKLQVWSDGRNKEDDQRDLATLLERVRLPFKIFECDFQTNLIS